MLPQKLDLPARAVHGGRFHAFRFATSSAVSAIVWGFPWCILNPRALQLILLQKALEQHPERERQIDSGSNDC